MDCERSFGRTSKYIKPNWFAASQFVTISANCDWLVEQVICVPETPAGFWHEEMAVPDSERARLFLTYMAGTV